MRGFLRVIYEEPDQDTYQGLKVTYTLDNGEENTYVFNTGCFLIDKITFQRLIPKNCYGVNFSSNYDHFFMDGDKYARFNIDHLNDNKFHKGLNWDQLTDGMVEYHVKKEILDKWTFFSDVKAYWEANKPENHNNLESFLSKS